MCSQELERALHDTQLLLEMRVLNPTVVLDDNWQARVKSDLKSNVQRRGQDDPGNVKSQKDDDYSPRKHLPGGLMAPTISSQGAVAPKFVHSSKEDNIGPPFRNPMERRQWLLQEKKRWLIDMRMGK